MNTWLRIFCNISKFDVSTASKELLLHEKFDTLRMTDEYILNAINLFHSDQSTLSGCSIEWWKKKINKKKSWKVYQDD